MRTQIQKIIKACLEHWRVTRLMKKIEGGGEGAEGRGGAGEGEGEEEEEKKEKEEEKTKKWKIIFQ